MKRNNFKCIGLHFRGRVNYYTHFNNRQTRVSKTFTLTSLKKKSCPGCPACDFLRGRLNDIFGEIINMNEIQEGKEYVLKLIDAEFDAKLKLVEVTDE